MNKIVTRIGLLSFFLSIIFFMNKSLPILQVFFRAFLVFVFVTIMTSIVMLIIIRSVKKATVSRNNSDLEKNLSSKST